MSRQSLFEQFSMKVFLVILYSLRSDSGVVQYSEPYVCVTGFRCQSHQWHQEDGCRCDLDRSCRRPCHCPLPVSAVLHSTEVFWVAECFDITGEKHLSSVDVIQSNSSGSLQQFLGEDSQSGDHSQRSHLASNPTHHLHPRHHGDHSRPASTSECSITYIRISTLYTYTYSGCTYLGLHIHIQNTLQLQLRNLLVFHSESRQIPFVSLSTGL